MPLIPFFSFPSPFIFVHKMSGFLPRSLLKNPISFFLPPSMETLYLYSLPVLFLLYSICQFFLHKLQNLPPTPFPALPLIGHLHLLSTGKPLHQTFSKISKRYGPPVFLHLGSQPALLVSSPSLTEECFTKNDIIFANRPKLLNGKVFGRNFTDLSWSPYGDHWRNLRRISSLYLLSSHWIQRSSRIRADEARILVQKFHQFSNGKQKKSVDMKLAFFEFMFNVILRMIIGKDYKIGAEIFQETVSEMTRVTMVANVVDFLPFMKWFGFKNTEKKMNLIQMKRDKFVQDIIDKYRQTETEDDGTAKQRSLMQVLLDMQKMEPESHYTDEAIRSLLLVLVHGAAHTSSVTVEWAVSELLENPDILTRAQAEIDTVVGKDRLIDESDMAELPFLLCIVNETLLLHAAVPLVTPHLSSAECTIGGFCIPRGTMLLVNAWDIQKNPELWEEAEKFKPDRFSSFEGFRSVKNELKFFPFGWGRRACPAENLAMRMVGLAVGSLIQCFEWEKVGKIDMKEGAGIVTPKAEPLIAKCNPRPFTYNLIRFGHK